MVLSFPGSVPASDAAELDAVAVVLLVDGAEPVARPFHLEPVVAGLKPAAFWVNGQPMGHKDLLLLTSYQNIQALLLDLINENILASLLAASLR